LLAKKMIKLTERRRR